MDLETRLSKHALFPYRLGIEGTRSRYSGGTCARLHPRPLKSPLPSQNSQRSVPCPWQAVQVIVLSGMNFPALLMSGPRIPYTLAKHHASFA